MKKDDSVIGLIASHGGELISRTRLQKEICLPDRCDANFKLRYTYHHYERYSLDLVGICADAEADGQIRIEEPVGRHGVPYAIFSLGKETRQPERLGDVPAATTVSFLEKMKNVSDIVLEFAAAIVFLCDEWNYYGNGRIGATE